MTAKDRKECARLRKMRKAQFQADNAEMKSYLSQKEKKDYYNPKGLITSGQTEYRANSSTESERNQVFIAPHDLLCHECGTRIGGHGCDCGAMKIEDEISR